MDTIELQCPKCSEQLEIDGGFVGGVCRCFSCGAMMTVPGGAGAPASTRPDRPDRPDAPGEEPAGEPATEVEAPPPAEEGEPVVAAVDEGEPIVAELIEPDEDGTTFTTTSGKTIKISARDIPIARRARKAIKAGVVGAFVLICVGVVVLTVAAIMLLSGGDEDGDAQQRIENIRTFDPEQNPFLDAEANVLGVLLTDRTAVIIDTSLDSQPWLSPACDAVLDAAKELRGREAIQIVLAREGASAVFPNAPGAIGEDKIEALGNFLRDAYAQGVASLLGGTSRALQGKPNHVVLITGRLLQREQIAALGAELDKHEGVMLSAVAVDQDLPELEKLVGEHNGTFRRIPMGQLEEWYGQWLQQEAELDLE